MAKDYRPVGTRGWHPNQPQYEPKPNKGKRMACDDGKCVTCDALREALRAMTANFRSSLLLVNDRDTRALGLELVRDAEKLISASSTPGA